MSSQRLRTGSMQGGSVFLCLNAVHSNARIASVPRTPYVALIFNNNDTPPNHTLDPLLLYLSNDDVLRNVSFCCSRHFNTIPRNSPRLSAAVESFVQTIQAANANPNVEMVTFYVSMLTYELLPRSFCRSFKRVFCSLLFMDQTSFSDTEYRMIERNMGYMENVEVLHLTSGQHRLAASVLRPFCSVTSNIGRSLQQLSLHTVPIELCQILSTTSSRLQCLSLGPMDMVGWSTLCQFLGDFIGLRELNIRYRNDVYGSPHSRAAIMLALRTNGSLQHVSIEPTHGNQTVLTPVETRLVEAYIQRNRVIGELRTFRAKSNPERDPAVLSEPTLLSDVFQAVQQMKRMAPTVFLSRMLEWDFGTVEDQVRRIK